jgi:hypothetical protein
MEDTLSSGGLATCTSLLRSPWVVFDEAAVLAALPKSVDIATVRSFVADRLALIDRDYACRKGSKD